ncbi:hypothetical protein SprV_0501861600 [Sparganum proliferum]
MSPRYLADMKVKSGAQRKHKDFPWAPQIDLANRKNLVRNRPTRRRAVKKGAAIYEANRITAAKAKREARKCQLPPPLNANAHPPPTCPRCQQTFREPTGLIGYLRTDCSTRTTPPVIPTSTAASSCTPSTDADSSSEPSLPSSSVASTSAATAPAPTATTLNPYTDKHQPHHRQHQQCGLGP